MGSPQPAHGDCDASASWSHSLEVDGYRLRLTVTGELCTESVLELAPAFHRLIAEHGPTVVLLDLARISFCDGRGLRLLLELRDHLARHGGQLVVVEPSHAVRWVLATAGLDRAFNVVVGGVRQRDRHVVVAGGAAGLGWLAPPTAEQLS